MIKEDIHSKMTEFKLALEMLAKTAKDVEQYCSTIDALTERRTIEIQERIQFMDLHPRNSGR